MKIRTNVNSDEAAVFGAGLRALRHQPQLPRQGNPVSEAAAYPAG